MGANCATPSRKEIDWKATRTFLERNPEWHILCDEKRLCVASITERTNAWISRNRRLARDYERVAESSEAFIYIAMIRLGLRRLARP
jgi:transposase